MARLQPRQPVPALSVDTLDGRWDLAQRQPERFSLVVFYRGLHCPICKTYVRDLDTKLDEFAGRGVEVVAISSDTRERAGQTREDWGLQNLDLGYGLAPEQARAWGLYRSAGRGKSSLGIDEPAEFSEPGLFLVRPDGTLYWGNVSTMPFARPRFQEILSALDFVIKNDYPARGELD